MLGGPIGGQKKQDFTFLIRRHLTHQVQHLFRAQFDYCHESPSSTRTRQSRQAN
jgi:hypothetical protein